LVVDGVPNYSYGYDMYGYSVPTKSAKDISAEDIGHWLPATGCASCRASHGLHRPSPADGQPSHVAEGNVLTSRGATSSRVGQTFVARVARVVLSGTNVQRR